jgi:hypothetical protein
MATAPSFRRKRIAFDGETWRALHPLSLDSVRSLQELADEAFRDLLKKHRRPVTLNDALRALLGGRDGCGCGWPAIVGRWLGRHAGGGAETAWRFGAAFLGVDTTFASAIGLTAAH